MSKLKAIYFMKKLGLIANILKQNRIASFQISFFNCFIFYIKFLKKLIN